MLQTPVSHVTHTAGTGIVKHLFCLLCMLHYLSEPYHTLTAQTTALRVSQTADTGTIKCLLILIMSCGLILQL